MKYKKLILVLSIFIMTFTYIIHPIIEDGYLLQNPFIEKEAYEETYNDDVIRFHVRANSDRKEDQDLKLKVRDQILKKMGEKFEDTRSLEESRIIIEKNIPEIKTIAEDVIAEENKDYAVNVSLGIEEFPVRMYGNLIFPQGNYEALIVEIGEAKGQNWWCVMFPPLCFVDVTHTYAYADAESELGQYIIDENQPLKLKSKIADFVTNLRNKDEVKVSKKEERDNGKEVRDDKRELKDYKKDLGDSRKETREKVEMLAGKQEKPERQEKILDLALNETKRTVPTVSKVYLQIKAMLNYVE